jgi:hypothetical protein
MSYDSGLIGLTLAHANILLKKGVELIMQWYKITISADEASKNLHSKIQDEFTKLFLFPTQQPRIELALFSGGWSRNNEFNLYFSPKCAEIPVFKALIDFYKGVPCGEPTRENEKEMGLLVGVQGSWKHMMWHPYL